MGEKDIVKKIGKMLKEQNPLSLRVIFEQIKRGKGQNLKEALVSDFRVIDRFMNGEDFFEGVRTVLVDRGDTPKWQYKAPSDVPQKEVDRYFEPIQNELIL